MGVGLLTMFTFILLMLLFAMLIGVLKMYEILAHIKGEDTKQAGRTFSKHWLVCIACAAALSLLVLFGLLR